MAKPKEVTDAMIARWEGERLETLRLSPEFAEHKDDVVATEGFYALMWLLDRLQASGAPIQASEAAAAAMSTHATAVGLFGGRLYDPWRFADSLFNAWLMQSAKPAG